MRHLLNVRPAAAAGILLAALASITGCAHHQPDAMNSVSGNIAYHADKPLSPDAVAYVRLADLSDDTIGGRTLLQSEVHPDGSGTMAYFVNYREKLIHPGHEYAVDVRLVDHGQLVALSEGKLPVITNGHGNTLDMTLQTPGRH